MKRITTLIATALAALSMTAAVGSASASAATVLCWSPGETSCPEQYVLPAGTTTRSVVNTQFQNMKFELKNFYVYFSCDYMQLNATTTAEKGSPLPATSDNYLNTKSCTGSENDTCTSASINSPPVSIEDNGLWGSGTMYFGTSSEPLTISFSCPWSGELTQKCTFAATSSPIAVTVTDTGGLPTTSISKVSMTKVGTGSYCLEKATLDMSGVLPEAEGLISSF